ncbi:unnamed protein product [Diatraea saccharalis]|uniref:Peptidase S1 domain-containing protein n=1 Tax=Diatraea saccharalis TaxID=40085 RepID=A0A9N9WI80_9NEOP|nr:unnamed protein product [Diatraea saccharalis]
MTVRFLTIVCYFLCGVALTYTETYDLIIIPVPKNAPIRAENVFKLTGQIRPPRDRYTQKNRNNGLFRLDIANYEDPTEMPDIDNFDYNNDRSDTRDATDYDNYGENKIVGGFEVDINLYPYHVAYGSNCGGAIIHKKWVITAGHCGKKPYVRVGSKYLNQGKKVDIKAYYVHPNWAAKNKEHPFDYDFQLLELREPLKFDENVQPIKIAHIQDMVIGKVITVTGWGNTEENVSDITTNN